jgi:hypothetical protein
MMNFEVAITQENTPEGILKKEINKYSQGVVSTTISTRFPFLDCVFSFSKGGGLESCLKKFRPMVPRINGVPWIHRRSRAVQGD